MSVGQGWQSSPFLPETALSDKESFYYVTLNHHMVKEVPAIMVYAPSTLHANTGEWVPYFHKRYFGDRPVPRVSWARYLTGAAPLNKVAAVDMVNLLRELPNYDMPEPFKAEALLQLGVEPGGGMPDGPPPKMRPTP